MPDKEVNPLSTNKFYLTNEGREMDKLEKDGKVAVLYSPGYGAGWSTWADDKDKLLFCFDAEIVQAVIDGDNDKAVSIARAKSKNESYTGGGADLKVEWIDKGVAFEVDEYDGYESIRIIGDIDSMTA